MLIIKTLSSKKFFATISLNELISLMLFVGLHNPRVINLANYSSLDEDLEKTLINQWGRFSLRVTRGRGKCNVPLDTQKKLSKGDEKWKIDSGIFFWWHNTLTHTKTIIITSKSLVPDEKEWLGTQQAQKCTSIAKC
jgi:hypothetical protein